MNKRARAKARDGRRQRRPAGAADETSAPRLAPPLEPSARLDPDEFVGARMMQAWLRWRGLTSLASPLARWPAALEAEFCHRLRQETRQSPSALREAFGLLTMTQSAHALVGALWWLFRESVDAALEHRAARGGKLRARRLRARRLRDRGAAEPPTSPPPPGMVRVVVYGADLGAGPRQARRQAARDGFKLGTPEYDKHIKQFTERPSRRPRLLELRELRGIRVFQILAHRVLGGKAWPLIKGLVDRFTVEVHDEYPETLSRAARKYRRVLEPAVRQADRSIGGGFVVWRTRPFTTAEVTEAEGDLERIREWFLQLKDARERWLTPREPAAVTIVDVPAPPQAMWGPGETLSIEWLHECFEGGRVHVVTARRPRRRP